jgi:hypothetical protein
MGQVTICCLIYVSVAETECISVEQCILMCPDNKYMVTELACDKRTAQIQACYSNNSPTINRKCTVLEYRTHATPVYWGGGGGGGGPVP